ncbi:MAG: 4-hydroxy-tetrahydrodipicolinate synthase, partial [Nitrospinaceae bacterium]|nr:4-hydroxy-tetrahydrodipicolinate synthase [Nitrospinaceae bacterium]NIR54231.1 4-hydroxy-tetrahydrodipicolinate synthase [Nitrospinaceae bacterium]NIS84646.1 4-hydroxy-tetrahydrodipicolinate synthase [Nitrospinaceae bacterium]NIT81441.1 4-hydroxy-tetrahydrodipicolinate synthase [Nitrospinaceae bacterium]NIU43724.1 4-hydroxy-tetrahydrodipicolinate synthase [Nitrospinaceae bacterium]
YYNKPSQEGLYRHFEAVARETDLPLVLYNVPGRTSVNMQSKTVVRLAQIKNIAGIKEASGSLQQIGEIIKLCPSDFTVLSGDDGLLWPLLALGAKGVISVAANILPDKMFQLCQAAAQGDMIKAREVHYELFRINEALFLETNPVPVKTALALMGKIENELRLPLAPLSPDNLQKLTATLQEYCLVK